MSPMNKFDTMPIGWPDPGQVQHHVPLSGCVDDGAEFGIKPDPRGANMVKALMWTVATGGNLIVTSSDAKAILNFITSLQGIGLDAPLITAAPALLAAAKSVRARILTISRLRSVPCASWRPQ